jgi:glycosyltransferase involved in cell wall biosynthesis
MKEKYPLVTVIIPTYNYGRFISDAIESVLKQTYPHDKIEIIVLDDGSTDNTKEVVKKYKKVKYVWQRNSGQAWAVRRGFGLAKGKYFFILNSDDIFLPEKVKKSVNLFESDEQIVHIGHPVIYWYQDGTKKKEPVPNQILNKKISGKHILNYFYTRNWFVGGGSTVAGRSELIKKLQISKEMYMFIDEFIVLSLLNKGFSFYLTEPLSFYRIHDLNYSTLNVKMKTKNVEASKAILAEIMKEDFDEKIKKLYTLKTIVTDLRYKEQTNHKSFSDIIGLWAFVFKNIFTFNKDVFKITKNYTVLQRSLPMFVINIARKLKHEN